MIEMYLVFFLNHGFRVKDKRQVSVFNSLSREEIPAFVRGLFDSDGSITLYPYRSRVTGKVWFHTSAYILVFESLAKTLCNSVRFFWNKMHSKI